MSYKYLAFLITFTLFILLYSCNNQQNTNISIEEIKSTDKFTLSTWDHGGEFCDTSVWRKKLIEYKSLGISEVLIKADAEFFKSIIPIANEYDIKIHAWMWTLNQPNDSIAIQYPEWYSVNRNGENSLDAKPYVDYYQWLSPFHPEACQHIIDKVLELTTVKGLASIHLDYVRYCDVILGADLQPKYNLSQNNEMPEYDYGYHPIARKKYKEIFDIDPIDYPNPELITEWRQFRLNAVTNLVNRIADTVHSKEMQLTAAVFPFPEMSRQMVRQAWNDWNLDEAYPMIYHNFYRQNINWIGFATAQCVSDVEFPINTGLYIPGFNNSTEDLKNAIILAKSKGCHGICLFTANSLNNEQKIMLQNLEL